LAEDFADLGGVGFKLLGESADAGDGDGFHGSGGVRAFRQFMDRIQDATGLAMAVEHIG
jgi:hypothetical protein